MTESELLQEFRDHNAYLEAELERRQAALQKMQEVGAIIEREACARLVADWWKHHEHTDEEEKSWVEIAAAIRARTPDSLGAHVIGKTLPSEKP